MKRIDELSSNIERARTAYYNGSAIVSDAVYDAWMDELGDLDPKNPSVTSIGALPVSEWVKVRHQIPMTSLNKVNTIDEFRSWTERTKSKFFCIADKLDGLSIEIEYEKGRFVRAVKRGDGFVGEDISANVRRMKGFIRKFESPITGSFRGEIVLLRSDHKKYFPEYKNPRNAASGISNRLDGKGCEHLTIFVYQAILEGLEFKTQIKQMEFIESLGFEMPEIYFGDASTCVDYYNKYISDIRESLDYDIDGLVISVDDLDLLASLGELNQRPLGQVALKFASEFRETIVKDIEWSVGKTGRITPVAVLNPVNLMGATIDHASLHNVSMIKELGIDIGATVLIYRANDIIPQVSEVTVSTGKVAKHPERCPSCSEITYFDGEYLVCKNKECPALSVGRLEMWVSELGILEWGPAVLEKLVSSGKVKSVADLYRLKTNDISSLEHMGEKSAKKLLDILHAASPLPLETILGGLSIPNCQTTTSKLVVNAGFNTVEKLLSVEETDLIKIPGLGEIKAASIIAGIRENASLIKELVSLVGLKERIEGTLSGFTFCFTGAMEHPRKELEVLVRDNGGEVKSSVGKGLNYLVIADPNSTSSKAVSARKYGTKCISEEEFLSMVA